MLLQKIQLVIASPELREGRGPSASLRMVSGVEPQSRRVSVAYGDEIACLPPCLPAGRDRQASPRGSTSSPPSLAMTYNFGEL